MKISGVKGIVWDLDGTLINSYVVFEEVLREVLLEKGHPMPSRETILSNFHGSLEECIKGSMELKSANELSEIVDGFLMAQQRHYGTELESHLYEDALSLAQTAAKKNIKQILVTNRPHGKAGPASPKAIIASTTLADYIHEVRPGDEVEYRKPDKRSLGDWQKRHNLKPNELIVIGDQFVDAQLAINIDARALLIKRNGDIPHIDKLTSLNNVIIVDSLEDIELD